jgi:hypothetical protein
MLHTSENTSAKTLQCIEIAKEESVRASLVKTMIVAMRVCKIENEPDHAAVF